MISSESVPPKPRSRLLVVEDEEKIAVLIKSTAESIGFDVVTVNEGDLVLNKVASFDPDVILLDLVMPGLDGIEVLRTLANHKCTARIVLMTGMGHSTLRKLAVNILTSEGYEVLNAGSGPEAIEQYLRHADSVKLLVTDVIMPGMSGQELFKRLSALRPGLPVLFMSGYTNASVVEHGLLGKGIAFLQKPFTHKGLSTKVREVLNAV